MLSFLNIKTINLARPLEFILRTEQISLYFVPFVLVLISDGSTAGKALEVIVGFLCTFLITNMNKNERFDRLGQKKTFFCDHWMYLTYRLPGSWKHRCLICHCWTSNLKFIFFQYQVFATKSEEVKKLTKLFKRGPCVAQWVCVFLAQWFWRVPHVQRS